MVQAHRAHLLRSRRPLAPSRTPAPRRSCAHCTSTIPTPMLCWRPQPARRGRAAGRSGGPRRHRALRDARISARQGLRRRLRGRAGGRGAHPAGARDLHIRPTARIAYRPHDRAGERRRACAREPQPVGWATRPVATADRSRGAPPPPVLRGLLCRAWIPTAPGARRAGWCSCTARVPARGGLRTIPISPRGPVTPDHVLRTKPHPGHPCPRTGRRHARDSGVRRLLHLPHTQIVTGPIYGPMRDGPTDR